MATPFPLEALERGGLTLCKMGHLELWTQVSLGNTWYYFHRGYVCLLLSPDILWAPPLPISTNEINERLIGGDRKINNVVVGALTSAVGKLGSRPYSNECSIIYAK